MCVSDTLTSRSRDMHGQPDCSHCRFRHLQGGWYRKTDGTKLGDMIDQGFLWDARIKVGAARHWLAIIGAWHQIIKCSKVGRRRATQDRSFCLAPVFGPPLRSSICPSFPNDIGTACWGVVEAIGHNLTHSIGIAIGIARLECLTLEDAVGRCQKTKCSKETDHQG